MRKKYLYALVGWMCLGAAQAQDIGEVLRDVERNNKELAAQRKNDEASKMEFDAENVPEDPSVEYSSLYGREATGQVGSELIVSQGFDFPTLYGVRNRENRERKQAVDYRTEALRRNILLEAKNLCLDLIRLNKAEDLLRTRRQNADELLSLYEERLKAGDVTIVEVNKIKMERMTIQTEVLQNRTAHRTALQSLLALNGNMPLAFDGKEYPVAVVTNDLDAMLDEIVGDEAGIRAADADLRAAEQAVTVSRQKWLPSIEVGYRRNTAVGTPNEHGFVVGGSIPLFSNRRRVKIARLQSDGARMALEDTRLKVEADAHALFNEMQQLRQAMEVYDTDLMHQTLALLWESVEKGGLSVVDYFTEADRIYLNLQTYMDVECDYQKAVAALYKHKL